MAATVGNRFWEIRSKHGRDKIFADPEALREAAFEYFTWCEDNPLMEVDFRGKDADEVHIPKMRAFTDSGLCIYLGVNTKYLYHFQATLSTKKDTISKDFSNIIHAIKEIIDTQQLTGAAAGFLNANIIARKLGLTDRTDITTKDEKINTKQVFKIGDTVIEF